MEVKGFVIYFQSINFGGDVWNATKELKTWKKNTLSST